MKAKGSREQLDFLRETISGGLNLVPDSRAILDS